MRPCKACPFRLDVDPYLTPERAREIAGLLRPDGYWFPCHETLDYSEAGDEPDALPGYTDKARWCAGALAVLAGEHEDEGGAYRHRMVQIWIRLGLLKREDLPLPGGLVPRSFADWIAHIEGGGSQNR